MKIKNYTSFCGHNAGGGACVDPHHNKFVCQLEYSYFRLVPNHIMFIQDLIEICPAALKLNHVDRQTQRHI